MLGSVGSQCRGFIISRPPLVLFALCLLGFAGSALWLAHYVLVTAIPDPDVRTDWNLVFGMLAQQDLCVITPNSHERHHKPGTIARDTSAVERESAEAARQAEKPKGIVNQIAKVLGGDTHDKVPHGKRNSSEITDEKLAGMKSVSFAVPLKFSATIVNLPANTSQLKGYISPSILGLGSDLANFTVLFTIKHSCNDKPLYSNCVPGEYCQTPHPICVTFYGPVHLLPMRPMISNLSEGCNYCPITDNDLTFFIIPDFSSQTPNPDNGDKLSQFFGFPAPVVDPANVVPLSPCSGQIIKLEYTLNPDLTVMLSLDDRLRVNTHLLYTSYFLLALVAAIVWYALMRGSAGVGNNKHLVFDKLSMSS